MFAAVEAWRAERLGKFTASEIHKLMEKGTKGSYFGKGAMTYIMEVVGEIITGETPEVTARAIEWGWANEYEAIQEYEKRTGISVQYYGSGQPKFVPYNDVAGGSPDGEVGSNKLIEVKCPYNSGNHVKFLSMSGQIDLKERNYDYFCQSQFNLRCTEREIADFLSYDPRVIEPRLKLAIIEITRDEELIKEMEERIDAATDIVKSILQKLSV
jgi:hypothetical protein